MVAGAYVAAAQVASGGNETQAVAGADTAAATTGLCFVQLPNARINFGSVATSLADPAPERSRTISIEKTLTAQLGDLVTVDLSTAAAVARVPAGSTGRAEATSQFTLRIGPCSELPPPTPVPTLSQWAVITTSILLAAIGYFGMRRKQSGENPR